MKRFVQLLFLLCACLVTNYGQQPSLRLENLSISQGLSQSEVNCINQDSDGFIWIGTLNGLNKYDGYDVTIYRRNTEIPNSISNNYIQSIFEDNAGNLWIGTLGGGLNRYDKFKDSFTPFKHDAADPKTIANNYVSFITQSKSGELLIATQHGLSVLDDPNSDVRPPAFRNYLDFEINAVLEDENGILWLATWNGLYKTSHKKGQTPVILAHYTHNPENSGSIASNDVLSLFRDKQGNIWIGTNNGLDKLVRNRDDSDNGATFTHYQNRAGCKDCLPNNQVLALYEDKSGKLLIGTRGGGLSYFDKTTGRFITYRAKKYIPGSLSNNSVKCIFEDRRGVLWIGTLGGGVDKMDLLMKKFSTYEITLNNDPTPSNFIRAIYEDEDNLLWIGTLDGGLYTFDRRTETYKQLSLLDNENEYGTNKSVARHSIYGKNVFSIIRGNKDELWIGTNGGVNILNKKTGLFKHLIRDYQNPDSLISNSVFAIVKDDDGSFWVGTWGGLHHYLSGEKGSKPRFVRYTNSAIDSTSLSDNIIRHLYNDPLNSDIWVSTMNGGLNRLVKSGNDIRFIRYRQNGDDPSGISSNEVNMVLRSHAGDLWIATSDGLNKLVPGNDPYHCSFIKYREKDGLAGNNVLSILEDNNGNLWIGTNKGLSKFNPAVPEFSSFDQNDGLKSNEFSEHTCFLSRSGEMFFGTVEGFNSFYPDSIRKNNNIPTTKITNLLIFNQKVPIGKWKKDRVILKNSITQTKEIVLSYRDNVFTIEFSALHFASPAKNRYAYKMQGFNDDWLYTGSGNRKATFTNLKGGKYTFMVKATNNDGTWQKEPTVLKIQITPPIWKSWPFFIFYIFVLIAIALAIYKEVSIREKLKSEVALKNLEKEKAEELNQMKLQFFTNISHEFRTPLTLIISPVEDLIGTIKGNSFLKGQLQVIYRNAKYLLRLINELMDFRKAETGSWNIKASRNDVVSFVRDVFSSFSDIAEKRNITFLFRSDLDEMDIWFDREVLIKILNNLIYNAFKFTADGGRIEISIRSKSSEALSAFQYSYEIKNDDKTLEEYISIIVTDNGVGISESSIANIFNRYYQVGSSDSVRHIGSGIGLALTKNLVLLSSGEITVSSERNRGTQFVVRLPIGDAHLDASEKTTNETDPNIDINSQLTEETQEIQNLADEEGDFRELSEGPLILVVEDNSDMRHFIKQNLEKKFRVLEAVDGNEGFKLATENIPDLVVSDVIMPGMDGIQLCKKLKKDILTSHIPVVLLTALSAISNQIEGLETGADEYISKPFNYRLFEIRIRNLIQSRKKLRECFGREIEIESKDFTLNWRDQEFMDHAIKLVKEKIAEPLLSVDSLSKELGMSRIHLHRKLTALTDQTPSEFIRTIRLKEAARLLSQNRLTVSEIAYQVGFTAPSYFSTCFVKQFGVSPSEYLSRFVK
ncbi:MAG TPA: two-component regulator propeller domain-containing protein [Bacteroidales bacterium]|nr:two-component regulator propeller domain-containing protein [Bacteroidales bacterium]